MRTISDTITRLSRLREQGAGGPAGAGDRLSPLATFGSNPGALRGWLYVPARVRQDTALVVVLHGCTQTAAAYDHGAGWSNLADERGFVVLFPEQQRQNNPNLCFNWFSPADTARGAGEALSIHQMIEEVKRSQAIDPARIFVTGLSAGGAMANVMLATYPEVFAGGAIIAGLPYGCARSVPEAFDRMRGHGGPSPSELVAAVRRASGHAGRWPTVSVWQGDADTTVNPANAEAIVAQWRGLHAVPTAATSTTTARGLSLNVWQDAAGRDAITQVTIPGMGHGTPLKTSGEGSYGAAGPFMLDVGISSTVEIARLWGLVDGMDDAATQRARDGTAAPTPGLAPIDAAVLHRITPEAPPAASGVGQIIEDALRKAGLMR